MININSYAYAYGNNYRSLFPDNTSNPNIPLNESKEEEPLLAQLSPPKKSETSPLLAKWVQLQADKKPTPEDNASKVKEEFDTISQFCRENGDVTTVKHPNPLLKNYDIKIIFTKSKPEFGIPDKYTVFVRKMVSVREGNEIKKRYLLESTTTYEHYPANNEENERITKTYTQELYKKDLKTGAYITDRDELTKLPKVLTSSLTIEIKDGRPSMVTEESDEDAILEKYMEKEDLDEGAKGRKRNKSRKARKRLKIKLEDKFKKDYFVRWNGFPMRNTTAQKMLSIRNAVKSCNYTRQNKDGIWAKVEYDIQVTCTTGGSHLVWQHKSGYAVDYVITKRVILSVKDKKTGKEKVISNKFGYLSRGGTKNKELNKQKNDELHKIINVILTSKEKNLYKKDEYFGTSTLKRGDHMHAHIVDPVAEVAARYPAAPGAKSPDMASKDIQEAFSLMNGYLPGEIK